METTGPPSLQAICLSKLRVVLSQSKAVLELGRLPEELALSLFEGEPVGLVAGCARVPKPSSESSAPPGRPGKRCIVLHQLGAVPTGVQAS
jgi:hypothetical protein